VPLLRYRRNVREAIPAGKGLTQRVFWSARRTWTTRGTGKHCKGFIRRNADVEPTTGPRRGSPAESGIEVID